MKEYEPSGDFVAKVMRSVAAYENSRAEREAGLNPWQRIYLSKPFRLAMSCYGALAGIFLIPATCL